MSPQELHHEKEESTETSSTLAVISEKPRGQERSLLELPSEQTEDFKKEKLPENSPYIITVHNSLLDEKLFKKTQNGPPRSIDTWHPLAIGKIHSLWCERRKDWSFKFKRRTIVWLKTLNLAFMGGSP